MLFKGAVDALHLRDEDPHFALQTAVLRSVLGASREPSPLQQQLFRAEMLHAPFYQLLLRRQSSA